MYKTNYKLLTKTSVKLQDVPNIEIIMFPLISTKINSITLSELA